MSVALLTALAGFALLAAACGDDAPEAQPTASHAVLRPATITPLRLQGTGFHAGERVRVTVTPSASPPITRRARAGRHGSFTGIVAKKAQRLVVVQSNTGKLFRIDLNDAGDAIADIDEIAGVNLPGGDGMILDRGRLVVVQGNDPATDAAGDSVLNFVKLRDGATRGEVRGTQKSDKLHGSSTVARAKNLYLLVNADFARSASPPFTVAGLPRGRHEDQRGGDHGDKRDEDRGDDHGDDDHSGPGRGDDDEEDDDGHGGPGRG
jgi:hypothetical protein